MSSPSALFTPDDQAVTVKEIRESPRSPGRYTVVLSSGQKCVVSVEALSDNGATRVGAALGPSQVERLMRAGAVTAAVDRAIGFIARGRRSRRELEMRLGRKPREGDPTPREIIAEALDRLEASGILSDEAVARAEASSRLRRGEAPGRVRQVLARKGIDRRSGADAIAEAVEADAFDEDAACRVQAEKRWRSLGKLDPAVGRRRLMAFLQRRGFSSQAIRKAIDAATRSRTED